MYPTPQHMYRTPIHTWDICMIVSNKENDVNNTIHFN